jgi:hypothetical protein
VDESEMRKLFAVMMRQAVECSKPGTRRAFGRRSELAPELSLGIPQGNVLTSTIRRVTDAARCADQVTQGQTRWSIPLSL